MDGGEPRKKEHTVIITMGGEELCKLIDHEARRQGLLKDVKSTVEHHLFDQGQEVSVEYDWEEKPC